MIHPENNMVLAYNEILVQEHNYRPYDGPLPVIDPKLGVRIMHDDVEFETLSAEQRAKEEKAQAIFDKHKAKIVEAFKNMAPIEFMTANGMPKLKTIEKAVGFMPSMEEREAAFADYKAAPVVVDAV